MTHARWSWSWTLPLVFLVVPTVSHAEYRQATIEDFADIYSGPGEDFYVVEDGEEGDSFPIIGEKGDWYKVKLPSGVGWIAKEAVSVTTVEGELEVETAPGSEEAEASDEEEVEQESKGIEAVVKRRKIKLYSRPTTRSKVVKKLRKGTRIEVVERSKKGRWFKIRYDGPPAWVRAKDVRLVGLERDEVLDTIPEEGTGFKLMSDRELEEASQALGTGFAVWAGIGEARLKQEYVSHTTSKAYKYSNYKPPARYTIATPAPAFVGGGEFWFTPNFGVEADATLVWAQKGLSIADHDYTAKEISLTMASYSFELAALARYPFLRPKAFFYGRLGYRFFELDVDQANPDPKEIGGAVSPIFWAMIYQGPVLGAGLRFPFKPWIGIGAKFDWIPVALAKNGFQGGTADTPSGDVDSASGLSGRATIWVVAVENPKIEFRVNGFFDYFSATFTVPDGKDVPRAQPPFLPYDTADTTEQAVGANVSVAASF